MAVFSVVSEDQSDVEQWRPLTLLQITDDLAYELENKSNNPYFMYFNDSIPSKSEVQVFAQLACFWKELPARTKLLRVWIMAATFHQDVQTINSNIYCFPLNEIESLSILDVDTRLAGKDANLSGCRLNQGHLATAEISVWWSNASQKKCLKRHLNCLNLFHFIRFRNIHVSRTACNVAFRKRSTKVFLNHWSAWYVWVLPLARTNS